MNAALPDVSLTDAAPSLSPLAGGGMQGIGLPISELDIEGFFLEYDTERAGTFEPLRYAKPGTTVVLGIVSSKIPALETTDDVKRRIDDAICGAGERVD